MGLGARGFYTKNNWLNMSKQSRRTQHKETKESPTRELALAKRENQSLKRQVSRLQKQLKKIMDAYSGDDSDSPTVSEPKAAKNEDSCIKCGSYKLSVLETPVSIIKICQHCKHRANVRKQS